MTAIEAQCSFRNRMIIDTDVHIFSFPSFEDDAKLTQTEREQILWKNAARLFKLGALLDPAQPAVREAHRSRS